MAQETVRIHVFHCTNSFGRDDLVRCCGVLEGVAVKSVSLPCSGKVDVPYLVKAFESGADGAVLIGCEKGLCRNLEGFIRAGKRARAVDDLLQEIGLGPGRIEFINPNGGGVEGVVERVREFGHKIRQMAIPAGSTSRGRA